MRLPAIPNNHAALPLLPSVDTPFVARHAGWPLLVFLAAMTVLVPLHGDFVIADVLFAWEGHHWALQQNAVTQALIHVLGKRLSTLAWDLVAIMLIVSLARPQWRQWRRPLAYLLMATAVSTAVVGTLKLWTNMDCPWDLVRYGGTRPFVDLFSARPALLPPAKCFPAGHASAGYAWVALYFFLLATRPALRGWGLAFGIAAGLTFGIAQQLRGAHFLSHDLTSLAICWSVALLLYAVMRVSPERRAGSAETRP